MFLKSLYISGFKSFAYPTKLDFTEDISAIVGPNGSGKSNISDAIRFVLGEQRTRLMRSQSMQDIIFSGTDSENPRGVAQVRLTMAREDQPDLIIERKYYRTGESEYYLNGTKVRLRDIQSEFLDTGLGKNGYSIISQGGVENIVGASPIELKELVEEAVGIAGYKVQQKETVRRLNIIQSNIERVSDILDEMEKQLKPLKKNADKTRQYLEISNTIRDIDLVSFYDSEVKSNYELKDLKQSLIDCNFAIIDLDKVGEQKDKSFIELQQKGQILQKELNKLTEKLNNLNENKTSHFIKESNLSKEQESNKIRLENLQSRSEELKLQIEKDKSILEDLLNQEQNKQNQIDKINKILNSKTTELTNLEKELKEQENKYNPEYRQKLQEQINQKNLEKVQLETEKKQKEELREDSLNKLEKLKVENAELNKKLEIIQKNRDDYNKEISVLNQKINELKSIYNQSDNKLNQLNNKLTIIENNINFQKNIKDSYSGFNEAVKAVMGYSRKNPNIKVYGTVSELFNTDKKYQTAIQIALGYSAQNIVVENSNTAKILIDFLKHSQKGRATFLPLDSLKDVKQTKKNEILSQPGVLGFANDLIKTQSKFKIVFNRLLGNTIIFNDYKEAQNFRKHTNRYTLVTLSGECFYASGAIVGGSIKKSTSRIFLPQQEIERLNREAKKFQNLRNELQENLAKTTSELKSFENKKNNLVLKLNESNNSYNQLKNKEFYNIREQKNLETLLPDLNKFAQLISEKESSLEQLKQKFEEISNHSDKLKENQKELEVKVLSTKEKITSTKIDLNSYSNELKYLKTRIDEIQSRIDSNNEMVSLQKEEFNKFKKQISKQAQEISELTISKENINLTLERLEKELSKKQEEFKNINSSRLKIEEEIKEVNKSRINEVEEKSRVERKIDKIEFRQKQLQDNIFEKYNQTFASIKDDIGRLRAQKKDLDEFEVRALKEELKGIGSVNINALDDYLGLKNRYSQLKENYDDLVESKGDVENTIESLNKTMSKQFKDKFKLLNSLFSEIFSILFEGGKSRLDYTDKNDILNSGIELYAQPPGKHLKNINLLSGGEKAMTAIALLFAFIQLNPTPFIIIDEIDAALDDSNINRFTNYIERIREDNQFIVITHRKGTIQMCNNIHGISMAADGISRCCSFEVSDYLK